MQIVGIIIKHFLTKVSTLADSKLENTATKKI